MIFTPHFPKFTKNSTNQSYKIETAEDLFKLDHVVAFKLSKFQTKQFFRFSLSQESDRKYILMAEYGSGTAWWVVGFVDKNIPQLPQWNPVGVG